MMRKLFFFFLEKKLSIGNGEKAVESFISCRCFRFFLLIPLLLSMPDPAPWLGFGAVKFVLPPGWLFLEEGIDEGAGSFTMAIARMLETPI